MRRLSALMSAVFATWMTGVPIVHAKGSSNHELKALGRAVIQEFSISPDGRKLVEVVASAASGRPVSHIVILNLKDSGRTGREIYSRAGVSSVIWLTNRCIAFVEPGRKGGIFQQNIQSGKVTILRRNGTGIANLVFDRRSQSLAYEHLAPWGWNGRVSVRVGRNQWPLQFISPRWAQPDTVTVRALRIEGGHGHGDPRKYPVSSVAFPVSQLVWRKNRLVVLRSSQGSFKSDIVDAATGRVMSGRWPLYRVGSMAVSPKGRFAVTSMRLWADWPKPMCGCSGHWALYVLGRGGEVHSVTALASGQVVYISRIWWAGENRIFAQILGADTPGGAVYWKVVEVDWRRNRIIRIFRWPNGDLGTLDSQCSLDADRTSAVCVAQTLSLPPRLVRVDLRTGAMRTLERVNPRQHKLDFHFTDVRVKARPNEVATGFLALPREARSGAVPLAVMLYGFDKEYSRDAQWITSYPVARMVHSGIAVLLLNWPYTPDPARESFQSTVSGLDTIVSLIADAVPAVRATGVRITRAMIMGWSFGGLYAAHAIQRLHEYVAAQVGDPAAFNSTEYALAGGLLDNAIDWALGGPPTRRYIGHYLTLDPAADGKTANGPILLEFVSRNPDAGQFLQEWRAVGTQVEAFVYRRSVHWLNVPAEAVISRARNLDWAKLNLFGPQSVSPAELRKVGLTVPANGWWSHREKYSTSVRRRGGGLTILSPRFRQRCRLIAGKWRLRQLRHRPAGLGPERSNPAKRGSPDDLRGSLNSKTVRCGAAVQG